MSSTVYSVVVFVHVLCAVVLIGNSLSFAQMRRAIRAAGTVEELRGWLAYARASAAANPVAALGLLATGVILGSQGWWTAPWFFVALALWFFDALFAARRAKAAAGQLGKVAAEAPAGAIPEDVDRLRWSSALDVPHDLLIASDVAILFIMFQKPGLVGCLAALAVTTGAVWVLRLRRRAGAPRRGTTGEGVAAAGVAGLRSARAGVKTFYLSPPSTSSGQALRQAQDRPFDKLRTGPSTSSGRTDQERRYSGASFTFRSRCSKMRARGGAGWAVAQDHAVPKREEPGIRQDSGLLNGAGKGI